MKRIDRGLLYRRALHTGEQRAKETKKSEEGTRRDLSCQGRHTGLSDSSFSTRRSHKRIATDSGTSCVRDLLGGRILSTSTQMKELDFGDLGAQFQNQSRRRLYEGGVPAVSCRQARGAMNRSGANLYRRVGTPPLEGGGGYPSPPSGVGGSTPYYRRLASQTANPSPSGGSE